MTDVYHIPALLQECITGLNIKPDGVYVDVTFGGGGHSREILTHLSPEGHLYGFDQDLDAATNIPEDERFTFVHSNFRFLSNFMRYYGVDQVDGILADLGVSFHHFDQAERGFSFRFDGALDMRMNRKSLKSAKEILNHYSKEQLADLFYSYGELKASRRIADRIINYRQKKAIVSVPEFVELIRPCLSKKQEKKELAQAFQTLRMEVNQEMDALKEMLMQAKKILKPGGRLSVISYHSLEDRLVKNFLKTGNFEGKQVKDFYGNIESPFTLITRKQIVPTEEEISRNPRSRSAKLRIAERKQEA
ncbi:MAG: 16S rRNA (cytosine(1402)-N(4))-methyltransferase RsmH [Candidatus Azobacteroides sp.]|nr:16S rRNA (cytosine(1402)-N(4))-methyltransferase RsmH [Candidatus Azobacteroides sp.]